jgi:hypothetical protein
MGEQDVQLIDALEQTRIIDKAPGARTRVEQQRRARHGRVLKWSPGARSASSRRFQVSMPSLLSSSTTAPAFHNHSLRSERRARLVR